MHDHALSELFFALRNLPTSWPGLCHGCPVHFLLVLAHGVDSNCFQRVTNHLDADWSHAMRHKNIVFHDLLKLIPWGSSTRL
jgi:hypothetical protein